MKKLLVLFLLAGCIKGPTHKACINKIAYMCNKSESYCERIDRSLDGSRHDLPCASIAKAIKELK